MESVATSPSISLTDDIRRAFLFFTVFCLGTVLLLCLYMNFLLLQPYFSPLFWAVILSIPLHALKRNILNFIKPQFENEHRGILFLFVLLPIKVCLKVILGPLWHVVETLSLLYVAGVDRLLSKPQQEAAVIEATDQTDGDSAHDTAEVTTQISTSTESADTSGMRKRVPKTSLRMPHHSAIGDQKRISSLSQVIVNSWDSSSSDFYFSLLFRLVSLYFAWEIYRFVHAHHVWLLALAMLGCFILHVLCVLISQFFSRLFKSSLARTVLVSPLISLAKYINKAAKDWVGSNLNLLVTSFIIVGFAVVTVVSSVFLAVMIGHEASALSDNTFIFLNDTISHSPQYFDQDTNLQLQRVWTEGKISAIQWADSKLNETVANLTTAELYRRVYPTLVNLQEAWNSLNAKHPANSTELTSANFSWRKAMLSLSELQGFFGNPNTTATIQGQVAQNQGAILRGAVSFFSGWSYVFLLVVDGFKYAFKMMMDISILMIALFGLTMNDQPPIFYMSRVLMFVDPRHRLRITFEKSVRAVFLTTFKMAVFHFVFTWLSFTICGVEYVYFQSFLASLSAVFPIVPPFSIAILPVLQLIWFGNTWKAIALLLSHFWAMMWVDPAIYSEIPGSSPLIVGYAIILGLSQYGIEGLVLGPVLASIPVLGYHIVRELVQF